jgi:glycosyltransferase involved in cell wall biosynthesis
MARPRVLILTVPFPPWAGGAVMRMTKLAKYLPELGWDVTVVCSDSTGPTAPDPGLLAELPPSVEVMRIRGLFHRIGGPATKVAIAGRSRTGLLGSLMGSAVTIARSVLVPDRWIGWAASASRLSSTAAGSPDVIISTGPPHSVHLAAARLARRWRTPWIADLRDDWAGEPFGRTDAPWQRAINRRLERSTLSRATAVVVVSDPMREDLAARVPELSDRISVIANGFDPADIARIGPRSVSSAGMPVRFLFAGRFIPGMRVGRFFQAFGAAARASSNGPILEILGHIDPEVIARATAAVPSPNLEFRPYASHDKALAASAQAGVSVVFSGGGGSPTGTMTGKLYELLALRVPILLVGPPGPAADLVRRANAGAVVDPEDEPGIRQAIIGLEGSARNPAFQGASADLLDTYDRRRLAQRWATLLVSASGARPAD